MGGKKKEDQREKWQQTADGANTVKVKGAISKSLPFGSFTKERAGLDPWLQGQSVNSAQVTARASATGWPPLLHLNFA